jgi:hypothetical protein
MDAGLASQPSKLSVECSNSEMTAKPSHRKNSKKDQRPIFDSIRKPAAPPGHPMSRAKPDEKARPAGRKAKHKRKPEPIIDSED